MFVDTYISYDQKKYKPKPPDSQHIIIILYYVSQITKEGVKYEQPKPQTTRYKQKQTKTI